MTDKEIKKALESKKEDMICAVVDKNRKTHFITDEVVLDLINRQQAEIERLQKDSKRLKKVQMQLDDAMKMYDVIKSEAIKEFAERLKEAISKSLYQYWNEGSGGYYLAEDVPDEIDNLVKEMVGK